MARKSFRLRRPIVSGDVVGVGSFVRGTSDIQATAGASSFDQDSAIRSKDIITVIPTTPDSVFEAVAIEYTAVLLNWTLTEEYSELADIGVGESGILNVAIVYSKTGYPQTVTDGKLIYQGTDNSYLHQESIAITTDQGIVYENEPATGKWAYYSLFAYYNTEGTSGTYHYELLSELELIVPKDYGSRDEMWRRIPKYYREQDEANDTQLERFIDTFGFELDRSRTLIDTMMVQYDPLLAEAEAVNELAKMLGLEIGVSDIGVSRTRALLHDIGYLRKNKGTLEATKDYVTAVSGGDVTVFTGASAPYYTFAVHAERANLIADPRFVGASGSTWAVYSENSVTVSTTPTEGITITAGATATQVAVMCKTAVVMEAARTYYMSGEFSQAPEVVYGGYWSSGASWSDWSATTAGASVPVSAANRVAYPMTSVASGSNRPVFLFKLSANQSVTLSRWMVEPNKVGQFFDGDTVFGGFLYQGFSSDYKWSGTEQASYSIYTTNRQKTQSAIERLLPQILPVTMLGTVSGQPKYQLMFDWIPGKAL
jgi:hypothetical protein